MTDRSEQRGVGTRSTGEAGSDVVDPVDCPPHDLTFALSECWARRLEYLRQRDELARALSELLEAVKPYVGLAVSLPTEREQFFSAESDVYAAAERAAFLLRNDRAA